MKTIKAILIGVGIWVLAVSFYTASFQFQILEDLQQQANMVLFMAVMPLTWLGAHLYYKSKQKTQGYILGLIFFIIAGILDALITVPLFIIPNGGSHFQFYTDLGFWAIGLEMILTTVLYHYFNVYSKVQPLKA